MTIVIILLFAIWCYSYIKFRRKQKYFSVMVVYLSQELQRSPSQQDTANLLLRLSSAFIEIQHYKDAYDIYEQLLRPNLYTGEMKERIVMNKDFCSNPFPGSKGPKNHNHSYWHNFILVRLGKRRYNFLTENDYLMTNSIIRNM